MKYGVLIDQCALYKSCTRSVWVSCLYVHWVLFNCPWTNLKWARVLWWLHPLDEIRQ